MDYQPQTMATSDMDTELERLLEAARDVINSVEATTSDTLAVLQQIESKITSLSTDIATDMQELDAIEEEAEEAFDTLMLEEAVDITD